MNRRNFLIKSLMFLTGSFSGFSACSEVFARERQNPDPLITPLIALIIDDIGFSLSRARQFFELGIPITFSILPRLSKSRRLASEIHGLGHEIMLHQPMEPFDSGIDPGPGALFVGDDSKKIIKIMDENFTEVPQATGVNNHMGSRFTASRKEMNRVLKVVKEKELYFVDSLTTGKSTAYETAKSLNMTAAMRNIFLDNNRDETVILLQLEKLKRYALKFGSAIGIGHPFPETARAIGSFSRDIKNSPFSLVYISGILKT